MSSSPLELYRRRRLPTPTAVIAIDASVGGVVLNGTYAGDAQVSAVASAEVSILRACAGAAEASAFTVPARLRLTPAGFWSGPASVTVTQANDGAVRGRGYQFHVDATVTPDALDFRLAQKLFGVPSDALIVTAAAANFSVIRDSAPSFGVVTVTAVADFFTNIYDDEPYFRTLIVPAQVFSIVVPAQTFVAYISTDSSPMITFTKQPAERLAYDIDFGEWFAELEGDDIEAASVEVVSASLGVIQDLIVQQPLRLGSPSTRVKIWVEAGLHNARYKLTLTIDTEGGRRKTVDFYVRVKEI